MDSRSRQDPTAARRWSFADLGVNVKILAAVSVAGLVALTVGVVGLNSLSSASAAAQQIAHSNVTGVHAIGELKADVYRARAAAGQQALSQDQARSDTFAQEFRTTAADFRTVLATYRSSGPAGNAATIDALEENFQAYVTVAENELIPAGNRNDYVGWAQIRDTKALPVFRNIEAELSELSDAENAEATVNAAGAQSSYESSRLTSILVLAIGLALAFGLGIYVARRIVGPLNQVRAVCEALAAGDLTRTSGLTTRDETGRMAQALDTAMGRLRDTVRTIDGSAAALSSASEQMTGTADHITNSAAQTSSQAQSVSAAAEQISRSVDTVSAGSEEMGASIREISENAAEAARVAAEAVSVTAATSATMSKLGESSAEIGNVIKVITAIAEQTNLLALNATIEAARAGDAGKGFAVVASEVKDLAQETARATEDISRRVGAIQADTTGAVTAIEEISHVIARISDFQTTIASAVEEQTATTAEMNRSVGEAATGTGEIAHNITGVADAAESTRQGAAETQRATSELARMSSELKTLVDAFRY